MQPEHMTGVVIVSELVRCGPDRQSKDGRRRRAVVGLDGLGLKALNWVREIHRLGFQNIPLRIG